MYLQDFTAKRQLTALRTVFRQTITALRLVTSGGGGKRKVVQRLTGLDVLELLAFFFGLLIHFLSTA